jgi:hypothetical protein
LRRDATEMPRAAMPRSGGNAEPLNDSARLAAFGGTG